MPAKNEATKEEHVANLLTGGGFVCQVDFTNQMTDGTILAGIVAAFAYVDGSESVANNPNCGLRYNQSTSLYSQDKCVKALQIYMRAVRGDGTADMLTDSSQAPGKQCIIHDGFGLFSAEFIGEDAVHTAKRPLAVRQLR